MNKVLNIFNTFFMKVNSFFKGVNWNYVFLMVNYVVIACLIFVNLNIYDAVKDLQLETAIQQYIFKQQVRDLNEAVIKAIKFLTENDKIQLEIDKEQKGQIYNLFELNQAMIKRIANYEKRNAEILTVIVKNLNRIIQIQNKLRQDLEKTKQITLENIEEIKKANFLIINATRGVSGSGTHIKLNRKDYILSCSHLIDLEDENLYIVDDKKMTRKLQLVKIDRKNDLSLFSVEGLEKSPYLEISQEVPTEGNTIFVIGNPANMQDIVTNGVIASITRKGYIFTNLIYFGNSGGAILYKGKIVGVVTQLGSFFQMPHVFVNYGFGPKLEIIREFLNI